MLHPKEFSLKKLVSNTNKTIGYKLLLGSIAVAIVSGSKGRYSHLPRVDVIECSKQTLLQPKFVYSKNNIFAGYCTNDIKLSSDTGKWQMRSEYIEVSELQDENGKHIFRGQGISSHMRAVLSLGHGWVHDFEFEAVLNFGAHYSHGFQKDEVCHTKAESGSCPHCDRWLNFRYKNAPTYHESINLALYNYKKQQGKNITFAKFLKNYEIEHNMRLATRDVTIEIPFGRHENGDVNFDELGSFCMGRMYPQNHWLGKGYRLEDVDRRNGQFILKKNGQEKVFVVIHSNIGRFQQDPISNLLACGGSDKFCDSLNDYNGDYGWNDFLNDGCNCFCERG